jgi:outer membrane receptor protein involved in Fe transport
VGDQYEGYAITQNRNIGNVTNKGWEFSYSQQYTFLPGYLSGLGSYLNLTLMKTSGNPDPAIAGRGGQPTHLASFTPFTYNGGITWRRHTASNIRVLANYRGRFFVSGLQSNYGSTAGGTADVPWVDLYQRDRFLCDVKAEYTVNRRVSVYADASNIFGAVHPGAGVECVWPRDPALCAEIRHGLSRRCEAAALTRARSELISQAGADGPRLFCAKTAVKGITFIGTP